MTPAPIRQAVVALLIGIATPSWAGLADAGSATDPGSAQALKLDQQAPEIYTTPGVPVAPRIPGEPELPEERQAVQIDEVIVTSTKRAVSLRDIPATITSVSGADLERQGIQSVDQIVALVPGVNLTDDGQGQAKRITIRGISADTNVNFTTGTLLGDIPFSDPFIPKVQLDPNPFDMASVEVLKGPQGTLFGGTGLNGMIRYVPEAPRFDETQIKYFAQYDSFPGNGNAAASYGAVINQPFANDTAALRLMGFRRESPGYIDDTHAGKSDVNQTTQYGYRGILGWRPADDLKISLMLVGQHALQDDVAFTNNDEGRLERSVTPRSSPVETEYQLANLGIEYSFDGADFVSQTSRVDKEYRAFLDTSRLLLQGQVPLLGAAASNDSKAWVQEFRLVSTEDPDQPWKWLVGLFYYNQSLFDCVDLPTVVPDLPLNPLPGLIAVPCTRNERYADASSNLAHLAGDLDLSEKAVFGELSRRLGERWELTLGARLYRTDSEGDVTSAGALYVAQTGGQVTRRDGNVKEQGVSPKATLSFRPTDRVLTYLSASRGFRFGGIQLGASTPTTEVPESFKSDSLWNYELGVRSQWLDRTLHIDASAYFIDWTNPQVYQQSRDTLVTFIDNVGGVEGRGIELSVLYLAPFLDGLSLNVSAAYNNTVTTEAFESSSGVSVDVGSPWPLSPRWQTSTSLAYQWPLESWKASTLVRHSYTAKACNTIECSAYAFGYRTVDLQFSLASLEIEWLPEISLSLNNLTDERGISNITTDGPGGLQTINYIPPRALVLRLSGSF